MDNNTEIKTTQTPEENTPVKKNRRVLKSGSYTLTVSAVVIAIVIAVNLFVSVLPAKYTEIDMSRQSLYSIGDTTREIVSALEEEVKLYYICENGQEDARVDGLLKDYAEISDKLVITTIDPAINPNFVAELTDEEVSQNSVIAVSDKRTTVAVFEDFVRFSVEGYTEMTESEFSQFYSSYYYSYGTAPDFAQLFYGEQYITSAISYVSADDIPSLYYTTGHGESTLAAVYEEYVATENYVLSPISLVTTEIPEDAEAVMIIAPTMDFTEDEVGDLLTYINMGGDVILFTSQSTYSSKTHPNLTKLCKEVGLMPVDGLVMEGDSSRYYMYQQYIIPIFGPAAETSPASRLESTNMYTLITGAHGIVSDGSNTAFTVTDILSTTDKAYVKTVIDENTTYEKQEGDIEGQFMLGAAATATSTDGNRGRFVWYSSTSLLDSSLDSMVGQGNSQTFVATLNWTAGKVESVSIIGKDISIDPIVVAEETVGVWKIVLCAIVPGAIVISGLAVWARRRRK